MRDVQTIALDGILQLIDDAEGRATAAHIAPPGLPPVEGNTRLPVRPAHDLFLLAFQRLLDAFGAPDHPREDGDPRPSSDGAASALALWEIDAYEVVLALEPDGDGAATVIVMVRTS